jgi:hypothetical protein
MQRSPGVSTIAIVVLIGSILILGVGLLAAVFALVMPTVPARAGAPMPRAAVMLAGSLIYIGPAVWGIVSGIGLWRLRNWARISTIVFAVLAGLGGLVAVLIALMLFVVPLPNADRLDPESAARALAIARLIIMAMAAMLLGVALWWGVLLTRPTVVQQFTGGDGTARTVSRRPLSISIVAVLMLIGAPFMLFSLLMRAPVPLFTVILTGGASVAYAMAIAGTLTYCGLGLLRLEPLARRIAIGYFVFGILSSGVFFLAPGHDARITELIARQDAAFPSLATPASQQPVLPVRMLMVFGIVGGVIGAAIPLYFLVTRRAAFTPPSDPIWPDAPG